MFRELMTSTILASLALASSGCGGESNTVPISAEEKGKIKTEPTPEKTGNGKQGTSSKAGVD